MKSPLGKTRKNRKLFLLLCVNSAAWPERASERKEKFFCFKDQLCLVRFDPFSPTARAQSKPSSCCFFQLGLEIQLRSRPFVLLLTSPDFCFLLILSAASRARNFPPLGYTRNCYWIKQQPRVGENLQGKEKFPRVRRLRGKMKSCVGSHGSHARSIYFW
jgi:hypothetical protein